MSDRGQFTKAVRLPPQNSEAEQALLGSIMLNPSILEEVMTIVTSRSFYSEKNGLVYDACVELFQKGSPVDLLSVSARLTEKKLIERIGGAAYLTELVNVVPSASNAEYYARLVQKKSTLRELIDTADYISSLGYNEEEDLDVVLDRAEKRIFSIANLSPKQKFVNIKSTLTEAWERLEKLHGSQGELRGTPTGFAELDNKLAGLQNSDLIILAARPSMGKTSLALDIARQAATKHNVTVGIFSLEMSSQQLVDRMLAAESYVDSWKLRTGKLSADEDFGKIRDALDKLSRAPIYIDDAPDSSIISMRATARRLKAEHGLGLIVVDYLQLMATSKNYDSLVQQVTEISRSLKGLARELDVPVLALSQLSRAVEARGGEPRLSDLRDSGCLAGDTLIIRADTGARVSIKSLVGKKNIPVFSINEHKRLEVRMMSKVFSSGKKKLFEIRTRSGRKIKASANHPFLTMNGWSRLDKLAENQHIALPRVIAGTAPVSMLDEELILLAHLLGDGCVLPRQPIHYTSADQENIGVVHEAAKKLFRIKPRLIKQKNWWHLYLPSPYRLAHGKHHPITNWFKDLGISAVRSYDKAIPDAVFMLPPQQIRLFLKHLWSTDGNISWKILKGRKAAGAIYYSSTSEVLAEGVQHLLLRLGIHSTLRRIPQGRHRPSYQVHVQGSTMQISFCKQVGAIGTRGEIVPELLRALEQITANTNTDVVPQEVWKILVDPARKDRELSWRGLADRLDVAYNGTAMQATGISRTRLMQLSTVLASKNLALLAQSDILWDEIVSITPLGVEEVFDATVPDAHNFVANDILVHNSIEQDADVVMFIHREDKYDKESTRPNVAKIIIAKHRNGPTGEAELYFDEKRVSFMSLDKTGGAGDGFGGF